MDINKPTNMPAKAHRLVPLSELTPGVTHRVLHQHCPILLCLLENQVHAVQDTCTHEDISLSLGALCEHRLRCPLHGSEFDIRTGAVLSEPADTDLQTFDVQIIDDWVCIV